MSTDARSSLFSGSERRDILRESAAILSGSHVATVCGVIQNLAVLAIVPPRLMGIWTTVRTLLEYANHSNLGTNRAAGVEIAMAAGRGDRAGMTRVADAGMTIDLVSAAVVGVVLLAASAFQAGQGDWRWSWALAAGAVLAVAGRYYAFSLTVLRSRKQFGTLGRARAFGAVSELVLFVVATYCFGFAGLLTAALAAQFINAWYLRYDGSLRFRPYFDRAILSSLFWVGWPMAAEAMALAALRSVDRFVILHCVSNGAEQLGWYKIAMVFGAWAFDQSNLVANVMFPRLGETFGRTRDEALVVRMSLRVAEVIALAMAIAAAGLVAAGMPLVERLLPAYRPGLVAVGGMIAAASLLGIAMPLRHALLTIGRTRVMLLITTAAAAVSLAGGLWLLRDHGQSTGVALGRLAWNSALAAMVCFALTLVACVWSHRDHWLAGLRVIVAAAYTVTGTSLVASLRADWRLAFVAACVMAAVPAWILLRELGLRSLWRRSSEVADASDHR